MPSARFPWQEISILRTQCRGESNRAQRLPTDTKYHHVVETRLHSLNVLQDFIRTAIGKLHPCQSPPVPLFSQSMLPVLHREAHSLKSRLRHPPGAQCSPHAQTVVKLQHQSTPSCATPSTTTPPGHTDGACWPNQTVSSTSSANPLTREVLPLWHAGAGVQAHPPDTALGRELLQGPAPDSSIWQEEPDDTRSTLPPPLRCQRTHEARWRQRYQRSVVDLRTHSHPPVCPTAQPCHPVSPAPALTRRWVLPGLDPPWPSENPLHPP